MVTSCAEGTEMRANTMLGLAAGSVGAWLFFVTGVSLAALLASMPVTWRTVRSSLGLPPRSLTGRRTIWRRYLSPMIVMIVAAGLAGCASQSEQHIQFFKAYGPGQVEARYLGMHILTVSQTDQMPPSPAPASR